MSEISPEDLLLEEYKQAFEHIRYVEAKRDRYVFGGITASGAVLALTIKVFSSDDFALRGASIEFVVAIFLLCLSLGFLNLILLKAYNSFSPVMKHYENVIRVVRSIIYTDHGKPSVKINGEEKNLTECFDTRKNEQINNRSAKISSLSKRVLCISCAVWFFAAAAILFFNLCRYYCVMKCH